MTLGAPTPADVDATLARCDDHYVGRFTAMASPCEVLVRTADRAVAQALLDEARDEALRIERKFSRYRASGVVHRIHRAAGAPVDVDDETALLLDYAAPPWIVGVDDPERTGEATLHRIELTRGALATSGDARRFVMHEGRRLGHILDPRTGWPVEGAPRAVTVLAPTCLEAGTLATFAILHGAGAKAFLERQGVTFRIA